MDSLLGNCKTGLLDIDYRWHSHFAECLILRNRMDLLLGDCTMGDCKSLNRRVFVAIQRKAGSVMMDHRIMITHCSHTWLLTRWIIE
jgi:hypothetical protein